MPGATPDEPHLIFRRAVEIATKDVGGNMESFLLSYRAPKDSLIPIPANATPIVLFTASAGSFESVESIIIDWATFLIEKRLANYRGDIYSTVEVFKAQVLANLIRRQKERLP